MVNDFLLQLPNWEWFLFGFIIFIFFASGITSLIIILGRLRWKFGVVITETINNLTQITGRDRARMIKFGDGGEEIFFLKRRKKYRAGYGKRIGRNQIMWSIGEDGNWYNTTLGNFDKKLLEVGVIPVDRDVRLANSSIRKGINMRYDDKGWMDKYQGFIYASMFFFIILAFAGLMWFAFDKLQDVNSANLQAIETSKEVMELASETLSNIDNIRGGGQSGLYVSNG